MDFAIQLDQEIAARVHLVNQFVEKYLTEMDLPFEDSVQELRKAMLYSATNGGKRFRPVLALLVGEMLGCSSERILPFAVAVEMIHTYSLIHDDLPCMDNDEIRRGKPTNHKVFGEDFALLAGDALLTEAFLLLANSYSQTSYLATSLIRLLSEAAGVRGMVGGQAIDLRSSQDKLTVPGLSQLHLLKTGALIRVAAEGAALIAGAKTSDTLSVRKFGEGLGLAFQIADDILDHGEKDQDARSFTALLGMDQVKKYLQEVSGEALSELHKVSAEAPLLEYLLHYNQSRQV
ncbi:MAG: polyprenyl synthetase family protein [Bdellovibrio sp.]